MRLPARGSALLLGLLLGACASVRHQAIAPLRELRSVDARLEIRPGLAGLERQDVRFDPDPDPEAPLVRVRARFLALERGLAAEVLEGRARGLAASVCSRDEATRLLRDLGAAAGGGERVDESVLTLHAGQEGSIAVLNQHAYLAAFELVASGAALLADPEVAVAQEGWVLTCTSRLDEAGRGTLLDLELVLADLELPFGQRSIDLVGAPLVLQVPSSVVRTLRTRVVLGADEALVLGGEGLPAEGDGRSLLVLLEVGPEPASATSPQGS